MIAVSTSVSLWLQLAWGVLSLVMVLRLWWWGVGWLSACAVPRWLVQALFWGSAGLVITGGLLLLVLGLAAAGWD